MRPNAPLSMGFLFSAMGLETAVQLKLESCSHGLDRPDVRYGWRSRARAKYERTSGADFGPVGVVKYAEALCSKALLITSTDEIGTPLRKAFELPGPVLIGNPRAFT